MKRVILTLSAFGLLAAGSLCAQNAIRVTVPFGFYVGESELMPAGTYHVSPCAPNVLKVQHCEQGIAVMQLTQPSGDVKDTKGKLVFYKYGDAYFLREVRGLPVSNNILLPMTSHEKQAQDELATVTTYETITVPKPDQEEEQPEQPQKPD